MADHQFEDELDVTYTLVKYCKLIKENPGRNDIKGHEKISLFSSCL